MLLFLLVALVHYTGFAQSENFLANGKVLDAATQQPLTGASVFCQNTTFGTITNSEGVFRLQLTKGGYDLVVSFTGYETQQLRINAGNATDLTISMKVKDKSLGEVTVAGSTELPDGLMKYGKFFSESFIGTTANAAQCELQNPEVLQFFFSKKKNRLKVKAKEDLVIVNKSLGYKIKYQLDSFSYEYGPDISTYSGYPFFEELPGTEEEKAVWKQNRAKAYYGSRLHFMRSYHDSSLTNEGFVIEKVDTNAKTLVTYPIDYPYDTAMFHVVDDGDVEILYNGPMRVIYKKALPDSNYLSKYKLPAYLKSQITIIDINEGFVIQKNGYFYEQNDVVNNGYWTWQKISELLPYNYNL